jgi:hypothetical protein
MTLSDINSNLTQTAVSAIAARTSTVTSSAVDLRTYKGGFIVQQLVGVVSGTTPTLNGKIQTSADGSTGWTDIAGATFTEVTATDSFQKIGFVENQTLGYIRYVGTIAGTTPSFTMGVAFLGGKERV